MSAWLVNILAGLYLSLLLLVRKEPIGLILWLVGFCLLTHYLRRVR